MYKTKMKATAAGKKAKAAMLHPGKWRLKPFRHLEWWGWELVQGPARIRESGCLGFECEIQDHSDTPGGGVCIPPWNTGKTMRDPQKVYENEKRAVKKYVRAMSRYLEEIDKLA